MSPVPLAGWENFYVIVGSSAGGLTGLTFVVIALVRDARRVQLGGLRTFVTPTIIHFSTVLGLAALLSMPQQTDLSLSIYFGLAGALGLLIVGFIAASLSRFNQDYLPVWEDWLWNVVFPVLVYAAFIVAAVLIWHHAAAALLTVALASLTLLFTGIHNAWDIAVFMTITRSNEHKGKPATDKPDRAS
jgi:hypothetical protein